MFWGDILIDLGVCVKQRKFLKLEDWSLGLMRLRMREKRMVEGDSMMALYLRLRVWSRPAISVRVVYLSFDSV